MAELATSIYDGEARYASHTRVNRLVYQFTTAELSGQTAVFADVQMNGKIHNIYVDTTGSIVAAGTTTGSFQLVSDILDAQGAPMIYHQLISALDMSEGGATTPYHYQTAEGAATEDGTNVQSNHLVVAGGGTTNGVAMDDSCPWTGLVCGTVRIRVGTSSAWDGGTAPITIVIIYE